MSGTIFKRVEYDVQGLLTDIKMGRIGLPDLQRPFVWKNVKIRDLFDSMYRGYPIGYLLFWETTADTLEVAKPEGIGTGEKQLIPSLLVVDGQQRLTGLFSVINGTPVARSNYQEERIRIAFNPLDEKFEVTSAAMERDKVWIPDISVLWSASTNILELVREYLEGLESTRDVGAEDRKAIGDAIMRLQRLEAFPLTSLVLSSETSEEDVSDVFVRINSAGKSLNQADFILTLLSVFWDEGRVALEKFCRDARTPSVNGASPFTHFIEPDPDQMLRVSIGLAFRRARLQHVYSILRGKNLQTNEFSTKARDEQFEVLREAQGHVLDVGTWHDFLRCLREAGFRKPVRSGTTLMYSYVLYLIGRTQYHVAEARLRRLIGQWFFMANLTGRYTGSPETAMDSDLAMLRDVNDEEGFAGLLEHTCATTLTKDFWEITLPNDLANSSTTSPSLRAYEAAQVILDAPVLYSRTKIGALTDPALQSSRSAGERRRLWPRKYLEGRGVREVPRINQIANLAYAEWPDGAGTDERAPAEYLPTIEDDFSETELAAMREAHALPQAWETLDYDTFLQRRRELMADVVQRGYQQLSEGRATGEEGGGSGAPANPQEESDSVEFKSTLRMNLHTRKKDPRMEHAVLKTLAAFLNTHGGILYIGVADDGTPVGIEADEFASEDKMGLHLTNLVKAQMGDAVPTLLHQQFEDFSPDDGGESRVLKVTCERSQRPVYVKVAGGHTAFYIRTGPATTELTGQQLVDHVRGWFGL